MRNKYIFFKNYDSRFTIGYEYDSFDFIRMSFKKGKTTYTGRYFHFTIVLFGLGFRYWNQER